MKAGRYRAALMGVVLAGGALAGCSRSEPELPEMNMTVQELEPTPEPSPTEEATPLPPEPVASPDNETAPLPPPEEPGADEQMFDDASATGMTARTDRDGATDTREEPAETRRRD